MTDSGLTQGDRIRDLFVNAESGVSIVAPFIKVDALKSLLEVVERDIPLRCVTRWLPREVAAGVSDPEIFDLLNERGNFRLSLVDRLHAKLYIADETCLAGSSNVTLAGLGKLGDGNIEVLVETTVYDAGVASTLADIERVERSATRVLAIAARALADSLLQQLTDPVAEQMWFPRSRRAKQAFQVYRHPPTGYIVEADRLLLLDVARSNVPPGLGEEEFRSEICALLSAVPLAGGLLRSTEDRTLTRADAQSHLESVAVDDFSSNDLWLAFVAWMTWFFPDKVIEQRIAEVALRRAEVIGRFGN